MTLRDVHKIKNSNFWLNSQKKLYAHQNNIVITLSYNILFFLIEHFLSYDY